jgi:hypothetical protein
MNKIDLGHTIQLLANIGVIAGIVFLAYELRQNTNVARSSAIQSIAQLTYEHNMRVATDPALRTLQDVLDKEGASNLSAEQKSQVFAVFTALMVLQQNRFEQMELGIIDESSGFGIGGTGAAYRRPIFAEFWAERRDRYPQDFQEFMEKYAPALSAGRP